ncbi:hypothetical protein NLO413_0934 [Candidatus Neoehrlichia lotoris str. RAC413]|uniref:Uncharacterized protein n=1 Tax=Candidatus Neoehrlichia procyonis str. RAC413 TaxID=1359163 RepID=A0A0F3NP48_9RICK|nr:hypothetical protein [Candidatus Neoehrlichia lotoris]KJV69541.1 hypothetical protein NLO413_0934 [Candidatus Neoehrlichia lotoris str. RAC413]
MVDKNIINFKHLNFLSMCNIINVETNIIKVAIDDRILNPCRYSTQLIKSEKMVFSEAVYKNLSSIKN